MSRDRPILICDLGGTVVGVAVPPCDKELSKSLTCELEKLRTYGQKYQDSKRGDFEIVQHGLQFGGGVIVSIQHICRLVG